MFDVVSEAQLALVAVPVEPKQAGSSTPSPGHQANGTARLMVEAYLSSYAVPFEKKQGRDDKGREIYILETCPFHPEHGRDACIMQDDNGALSAHCFHNGCAGRGWQEFKAAIGPLKPEHFAGGVPRAKLSGPGKPPDDVAKEQAPAEANLTDCGNGVRLIKWRGADMRFCHPWKKWLCWDGIRWREDSIAQAQAWAKQTVRGLFAWAKSQIDELAQLAADGDDEAKDKLTAVKEILNWALKSQAAQRIHAMLDMAKSEPGIPILPDVLDQHPMLFNCRNGTLDLATGILRPHRREDFLTKLSPILYDPQARCPVWEAMLAKIMMRKADLIAYVQRLLGYCLTGLCTEQILPIWWGEGSNGKSTVINAFLDILGEEFGGKANRDLLMAIKGDKHPTQLAWLHGRRFVAAIESDEGAKLDEGLIKELTGGDVINARRMREDPWTFKPTHKLSLITNHKPVVRGQDHAIWRRLRLIPFNVIIPDAEQDKALPDKLKAEYPGILAWCVRGCLAWQREGLRSPEEVLVATREYRASQDVLAAFIEEVCVTGHDYQVRASELFSVFQAWCKKTGEKDVSNRRFCADLRDKGYADYTSNGLWFKGIMIRAVSAGESSQTTQSSDFTE